jgi:hypothetical protein
MSASHAVTLSHAPAEQPRLVNPIVPLGVGAAAIVLTAVGAFLTSSPEAATRVGLSWLIGMTFWIAISIGILLLVMIHHIFDAGWSTVIRRTHEHWLAVFTPLAVLFVPLIVVAFAKPGVIWTWMDTGLVGGDILYTKKAGFLNVPAFVVFSIVFFASWIFLSWRLRKHSFAQDVDGSVEHTRSNRVTAAFGIPLAALTLTFAAFYWIMSLEYHWFSTMFGVWFFASCIRAALAMTALLCIFLVSRGVLAGIFTKAHLLNLGNLMLAFTVFWAYISFSQYFLIWNANIPEETFWYNVRESGNWWNVGMVLIFGHFLFPFLFLLQHPLKKKHGSMIFICVWILAIILLDFYYNILPSLKVDGSHGVPVNWHVTVWDVTSLVGIGGVCFWAFFSSYAKQRCIPVRDPRIVESLHLHE